MTTKRIYINKETEEMTVVTVTGSINKTSKESVYKFGNRKFAWPLAELLEREEKSGADKIEILEIN